ncbi:MAG: alpha/beta hydrolase [Deltaproteobacteria bacterium]|nr:alpha/beta hydrolase [Deltaproteobacteria bacterium]
MMSSAWPGIPALSAVELPRGGWDEWLLSRLGSALDAVILRAIQLRLDTVVARPEEMPAVQAAIAPYLTGELWEDPRRFFSFVDAPVAPLSVSSEFRRFVNGDVVMAREFATAYQPYRFAGTTTAEPTVPRKEDKVLIEHWQHEPGRARATVLALHGFTSGNPRLDAFLLFAAQCFDHGLDVALLTLPYHGARTPPEAQFSGERFGFGHVAGVNEAVRQTVYETHMVGGWLREQTGAPVGLLGMSLGGYVAALMAGLTKEWEFIIPMVPPACMGDIAWRFFCRSRHYRAEESPISCEQLRAIYRIHSPLTYPRRVDKDRILILAARGDQFVPPEHPHALWQHWGQPAIDWFGGSHTAPFRRRRLISQVLAHTDRFVGRPKRAAAGRRAA